MRTCKVLAFIKAHELAKGGLKKFCSNASTDEYSAAEIVVLRECDVQIQLAEDALNEIDKEQVQQVKSHYACQILLNKAAHFLQTLTAQGLMTQGEAGGIASSHFLRRLTSAPLSHSLTAPPLPRRTWVIASRA
jgi:hypothetical protein